ncbi:hypothetical protein A1OE_1228 [Candidatus Endolissoclinum faulkneri L2]|uniref:Uncharacterized protein n=1 Tax=Candidatus Endolissoclinum faulkneri L2 TaxID=1193729 RepID=K7Z5Q7_9PROT|nr:hypothetical protein A1OE_1228 [Candidatus Endolissoclinum faulkneri L2]
MRNIISDQAVTIKLTFYTAKMDNSSKMFKIFIYDKSICKICSK